MILTIYILSRDRPNLFQKTIESVLSQKTEFKFSIVVSDNSDKDDVQQLVYDRYPSVTYIRRKPTLSSVEHFRVLLDNVSTKYFVLFHDDDVMLSDYVDVMLKKIISNENFSALGCNASYIYGENLTSNLVNRKLRKLEVIESKSEFLKRYFHFDYEDSPLPFPGYIYNADLIKGIYLERQQGGKHSDVTFLLKLLDKGPIGYMPNVLMRYRKHSGNDSGSFSIYNQLSLLRYLYSNKILSKKSDLIWQARLSIYRLYLISNLRHVINTWKGRVIIKFLILSSLYILTRPTILFYVVKTSLRKIYEKNNFY